MKYRLRFTLDYEIHGNGDGNPYDLMVEPTYRLMDTLEKYGQRVTIMADAAEILKFKKVKEQTGKDFFHVGEIERQLKDAVKRGHEVQLHIHSSYFKAKFDGKHLDQHIDEYNLAALAPERIEEMVGACAEYLENLLREVKPDYKCTLFRAANWSMIPTPNLYDALVKAGITSDTSVYKGGCQGGNVCYDYREAYDNLFSYKASRENINERDDNGAITEYPIYTEMRHFWSFITPMRIFRMIRAKFHKHKHSSVTTAQTAGANSNDNRRLTLKSFFVRSPWKLDFSQAEGRQMIAATKRAMRRSAPDDRAITDIILIGHSKTFFPHNEIQLKKFLKWASKENKIIKYQQS